jgi:hypothetical protein
MTIDSDLLKRTLTKYDSRRCIRGGERHRRTRPASNKPSKPKLCGTFAMETAFARIEARSGGS